jgi:hypothetical protein
MIHFLLVFFRFSWSISCAVSRLDVNRDGVSQRSERVFTPTKSLSVLVMALYLLDYGAGNVKSLANSLKKLGHDFKWIEKPEDFAKAEVSWVFLIASTQSIF